MRKAVVLGADNGYLDKVEVTIKSVVAHNDDIHFYILNDDIPSEWFRVLSHRLAKIGCEISNIKITEHPLKSYHSPDSSRLNYAMFFRYYIPHYVSEERALYIDSDIVVTGSLDELFEMDLKGMPLAAVQDVSTWGMLSTFNSGVMLIDTEAWQSEQVLEKLIELTNQHHETAYGDQGILNMYFGQRWLPLSKIYNYMVGLDSIVHHYVDADYTWYDNKLSNLPVIIHYTADKPWKMGNQNRFKDIWWFYRHLDWSDILLRSYALKGGYDSLVTKEKYHTAIFTLSADMKHLEYLIKNLPQVHFHLLAPTNFAGNIIDLQRYLNVSLYPSFNPFSKQAVIEKIDFYLDINYYGEVEQIIETMHEYHIPVLTFEDTNHDAQKRGRVCVDEIDMIQKVKRLLC